MATPGRSVAGVTTATSNGPVHVGAGVALSYAAPAEDVAAIARHVEHLGFDSLWLSDANLGHPGSLEPLTMLGYVAAVTERVRLGVSVLIVPPKVPVQLAQMLATVDQLSGGRVIAGLGLGRGDDLAAYGVARAGRAARFDEAVELLRAVWEPGPATVAGATWQIDGVDVQPKPVQQPGVPLWFGGGSDGAIDRAARYGDGWTNAGMSQFADAGPLADRMRAALERDGRDPSSFTIGKRVYIAIDDDEQRALERVEREFHSIYGRTGLGEGIAVYGSVDHVTEQVTTLRDHGYTFVMLHPVDDQDEQLQQLAESVVPALRSAWDA